MATSNSILLLCLWLFVLMVIIVSALGGNNFYQDFDILWGNDKVKVLNNEELVTLSLDMSSGSGFQSKNEYLFGKIDMQLKLVPGNSAGTVTSYYLSSKGPAWDEIDFEFLGNLSGDPYTLHTNVITQGKADREQQFRLWFDPTLDFHNYSILWNPLTIVFYVDGSPIREFKNLNSKGIAFPKNQAMRLYFSLWNGDGWATRGGLIKIDWTKAPFTASLRNFNGINGCVRSNSDNRHHQQHASSCDVNDKWMKQDLNEASLDRLKWVQKNHMIYNYCTDTERFPQGPPPECSFTRN